MAIDDWNLASRLQGAWSDGGPLMWRGAGGNEEARAVTEDDIARLRADDAHQQAINNPQTLKDAREAGLFGTDLKTAGPETDQFLSRLFQSKGLNEQDAIAAAIQGSNAHQAKFGQGYTTGSSLSGIFNDFILSAAGVAADQNLETLQGWTRHDAEARAKRAADIEHGGDFGSATGLGQILSYQSNLGSNVLEAWKKDPERAALGINTPFESAVWEGATGKDYRPTVDMTGGSTAYDTQSAQAKGIDTQSGDAMQRIAKLLAMHFGMQAVNGAAGGVSSSSGSDTLVGDAGNDTLSGSGNMGDEFDPSLFSGGDNNDFFTGFDSNYNYPDETGAFDMYGSNAGAPGGQAGSVFDYGSSGTNYLQQAQNLASKFGITPASALQMVLKAAGRAAPAALGAVAASKQADSLGALSDKYLEFGAPSRARYEASFAPGFTMANDPGYMDALNASSKATLHGLSMQGNPAGSPNAWSQSLADNYAKTAYPALQNFRNTNANAGGIASLQTSAPGFDASSVNAGKGVYDAIGGGLNDIFSPKQSLAQQLADYKRLLGTAA